MLQLKLDALFKAYGSLGSLRHILEAVKLQNEKNLSAESFQQLNRLMSDFCDLLAESDMPVSLSSGRELASLISSNPSAPSTLWEGPIGEFLAVVRHEMHTISAWRVSREKLIFFDRDLFGQEVRARFPTASDDIEEAGRCLGMDRNTAAVFHLMRVMETGLRALGKALNDPNLDPKRNPSWETILRKCDQELQKPLKERLPEWASDEAFFSTATANLRAVKDAWRNPTMHVERRYNDEEARGVWDAARAFMRHLATKLGEGA